MEFYDFLKLSLKNLDNMSFDDKVICSAQIKSKIARLYETLNNVNPISEKKFRSHIIYPAIWKGLEVGSHGQIKALITPFVNTIMVSNTFSKLLPNIYSVDDFFNCHTWSEIWFDGGVIIWKGKNYDEFAVRFGSMIIRFIDTHDDCFVWFDSKACVKTKNDFEKFTHILLDLVTDEYSKLSVSQEKYYQSLDIPWIYRKAFISQAYLASLNNKFTSQLQSIDDKCRHFILNNAEEASNNAISGMKLTQQLYLSYCRVAREAVFDHSHSSDRELTDVEFYKKFTGGRHYGLLDIEPSCPNAFSRWFDSNKLADPFTLVPASTSHDSFHLIPEKTEDNQFTLLLRGGYHNTEAKKLVFMGLASSNRGAPIIVNDIKGIKNELEGNAMIGILPINKDSFWTRYMPKINEYAIVNWISVIDLIELGVNPSMLQFYPLKGGTR